MTTMTTQAIRHASSDDALGGNSPRWCGAPCVSGCGELGPIKLQTTCPLSGITTNSVGGITTNSILSFDLLIKYLHSFAFGLAAAPAAPPASFLFHGTRAASGPIGAPTRPFDASPLVCSRDVSPDLSRLPKVTPVESLSQDPAGTHGTASHDGHQHQVQRGGLVFDCVSSDFVHACLCRVPAAPWDPAPSPGATTRRAA